RVVELSPGRSKAALLACLGNYALSQMHQIEAVALDMCKPYILLLQEVLPEAQTRLVFDRYHIMLARVRKRAILVKSAGSHQTKGKRAVGRNGARSPVVNKERVMRWC